MYQLPPIKNDEVFEKLIRDIHRKIYNAPDFELYGRRGQAQHGIDGYKKIDEKIIAFQCKQKTITHGSDETLQKTLLNEMNDEVVNTNEFDYEIDKYVFATTFKNDTKLQDKASELSHSGFAVTYWGWETISGFLEKYPELLREYYPDLFREIETRIQSFITHIDQEFIKEKKSTIRKRETNLPRIFIGLMMMTTLYLPRFVMTLMFPMKKHWRKSSTVWITA